MIDYIRYFCHNCNNHFPMDGDSTIGSTCCPYCLSKSIEFVPFDHKVNRMINNMGVISEIGSEYMEIRKLIIKVYGTIKNFHPLYFISPMDDSETKPIGTISKQGMESLHESNLLIEIPATEIIEIYFKNKWMLSDIKTSKFYELRTKAI